MVPRHFQGRTHTRAENTKDKKTKDLPHNQTQGTVQQTHNVVQQTDSPDLEASDEPSSSSSQDSSSENETSVVPTFIKRRKITNALCNLKDAKRDAALSLARHSERKQTTYQAIDDTDGLDDLGEYLAWREREQSRIARDRAALEEAERD